MKEEEVKYDPAVLAGLSESEELKITKLQHADSCIRSLHREKMGSKNSDDKKGSGAICQSSFSIKPCVPPKKCKCAQILITDDCESNLFVLQSYLKSTGIKADEVCFIN